LSRLGHATDTRRLSGPVVAIDCKIQNVCVKTQTSAMIATSSRVDVAGDELIAEAKISSEGAEHLLFHLA
jgi:hypothetical protein